MYKNKARIKSGPFIHKARGVFLFFIFFTHLKGSLCAPLEPFLEWHSTVASGTSDDPPHCPLPGGGECGKISATNRHNGSEFQMSAHIIVIFYWFALLLFLFYKSIIGSLSCLSNSGKKCLYALTGNQVNNF